MGALFEGAAGEGATWALAGASAAKAATTAMETDGIGRIAISSIVAERTHELVDQRLGHVGEQRTLAGLDIDLGRHTAAQL